MQKDTGTSTEEKYLRTLYEMEDVAEKKANIYARLLLDASLAKFMEELASMHQKRKQKLWSLRFGEEKKTKNGRGVSEVNEK